MQKPADKGRHQFQAEVVLTSVVANDARQLDCSKSLSRVENDAKSFYHTSQDIPQSRIAEMFL